MLYIVICEDQFCQRERLKSVIETLIEVNKYPAKVALATSEPTQVKKYLEVFQYEKKSSDVTAYFLDIDLDQDVTGLELAHMIRRQDPDAYIIFVTIMQRYMREAFRCKTLDFIVKTYSGKMDKEVADVIDRLVEDYQTMFVSRERPELLKFYSTSNCISVPVHEFVGIKKEKNSYVAYTLNGVFRYFKTLQTLMDRVEVYPNIVRCHESAIINVDHIVNIIKDKKQIMAVNGVVFPVARRRMSEVVERWQAQ